MNQPPLPPPATPGPLPKVPIPRLQRPADAETATHAVSDKQRVPRACKNCRKRKVKCSGETPQCKYCYDNDLQCEYDMTRRDRLKVYATPHCELLGRIHMLILRRATEQNVEMVKLLRDLKLRATDPDRRKIESVLHEVCALLYAHSFIWLRSIRLKRMSAVPFHPAGQA